MATASNSAEGEILLSGDLDPNSTGTSPQLKPIRTAATHVAAHMVIDKKGRTIYSKALTGPEVIEALGYATTGSHGVIRLGDGFENHSTLTALIASQSVRGLIKIDNVNVVLNGSGQVSIVLPWADAAGSKGLVQIGSGLTISSGILSRTSFQDATTSAKGFVRPLTGDGGFKLSGNILSTMATSSLTGTVKVDPSSFYNTGGNLDLYLAGKDGVGLHGYVAGVSGSELSIAADGTLNFSGWDLSGVPIASASTSGKVRIGTGLTIDASGTMHVTDFLPATTSIVGSVRIGSNVNVNGSGVVSVSDASTSTKGVIQVGTTYPSTLQISNPGDSFQNYLGLRFARADLTATTVYGVVKSANPTANYISISNGDITVDSRIPRKSEQNIHTKSHATAMYSTNISGTYTQDVRESNVYMYTVTGNATMGSFLNVVPGQVVTMHFKKSAGTETLAFNSNFKFNTTADTDLSTTKGLMLTILCLSSTVYLVLNHGTYTL